MAAIQTNPLRVGLRQERVISPQCLVIFGASGDLTHRKLIPALFELFGAGVVGAEGLLDHHAAAGRIP